MIGSVFFKKGLAPKKIEALVNFVFEDTLSTDNTLKVLNRESKGKITAKIKKADFKGKSDEVLLVPNVASGEVLFLIGLGKKKQFNLLSYRNTLAALIRIASLARIESLHVPYFDELKQDFFEIGKHTALAVYLANYRFLKYKAVEEQKKQRPIRELTFYAPSDAIKKLEEGRGRALLLAQGVYLTRDLVNEPASHLHVEGMVEAAFQIEKESKGRVKVDILDEDECRKIGMGAYLGVAQGSDRKPKFIVLTYKSKNPQKGKKMAIVGKTIIFDSGGLSLKPSKAMEDMKTDMAGGATVLGVFKILANLPNVLSEGIVYGVLPACENMPSGKALRPGDIVRAANGKTIEVLNTDAEGRLALADALCYAETTLQADYIIDLATLTGACMVALGTDLTGLFGNNADFTKAYIEVAKAEGDELWELPLYMYYLRKMKSEIADLKNVSNTGYAGAITAAVFLAQFVKQAKWIHLDIAGPAHRTDEPKGVLPKGATGWGVISVAEFIPRYIKN